MASKIVLLGGTSNDKVMLIDTIRLLTREVTSIDDTKLDPSQSCQDNIEVDIWADSVTGAAGPTSEEWPVTLTSDQLQEKDCNVSAIVCVIDANCGNVQAKILQIRKLIDMIYKVIDEQFVFVRANQCNHAAEIDSSASPAITNIKPMFMFLLNMSSQLNKEETSYLTELMQDKMILNARLIRDHAVFYAYHNGFYAECWEYAVSNNDQVKNIISRIKKYSVHNDFNAELDLRAAGSLEEQLRALYQKIYQESNSFFAMHKDHKAIKLCYLRRVLHAFEERPDNMQNDKELERTLEEQFQKMPEASKAIIEKGVRSRIRILLTTTIAEYMLLRKISSYRDELNREIESSIPCFNRGRKQVKAQFLTDLIDKCEKEKVKLHLAFDVLLKAKQPKEREVITAGLRSKVKKMLAQIPVPSSEQIKMSTFDKK